MEQIGYAAFKFKFVYTVKETSRTYNKRSEVIDGHITGNELIFIFLEIPLALIAYTFSEDNIISLYFSDLKKLDDEVRQYMKGNLLRLKILKESASYIEKLINKNRSEVLAGEHLTKLEQEDKVNLFQTIECPNCESTIDLTGFKSTHYIYCPFCRSVVDQDGKIVTDRNSLSLCAECNLYNFVKRYQIVYLIYLIFYYKYTSQKRYLCGNCASKIGTETFLINMIFLIGIPYSLVILFKARRLSNEGEKELLKANDSGEKGQFEKADQYFDKFNSIYANHPEIFYNKALVHIRSNDYEKGKEYLLESLNYCSNFYPSLRKIHEINS